MSDVCFQVTPVLINQQNGTQIQTQAISLDLLKANGTPTLVTDSNGNHYLIALTSHTTDGQNGVSSLGKSNGRITLQVQNTFFNWRYSANNTRCDEVFICSALCLFSSSFFFFFFSFFRDCSRVQVNSPALTANQKSRQRPRLWANQSKRYNPDYIKHAF